MVRFSRLFQWLFIGAFLVTLWVGGNQDMLLDWLNVKPQASSPDIERLATATAMTRSAQRIFYRQDPTIEQRREFLKTCSKVPVKGVMMGCYSRRGSVGKIAIQVVTEPRLQGMMEVTAAHEMLHAAYDKFSQSERDRLTPLLESAVTRVKDERLLKVLNQYKADDRERYLNELHSHLGTEISNLGEPELEKYYQKYFTNRQQTVSFAVKAGSTLRVIDERAEVLKPEIDRLEIDLKARRVELDSTESQSKSSSQRLEEQSSALSQIRENAENGLANVDRSTGLIAEFENQRTRFNDAVEVHNAQVRERQVKIDSYNNIAVDYKKKVDEYNQLGHNERSLFDSLREKDSTHPAADPNSLIQLNPKSKSQSELQDLIDKMNRSR